MCLSTSLVARLCFVGYALVTLSALCAFGTFWLFLHFMLLVVLALFEDDIALVIGLCFDDV